MFNSRFKNITWLLFYNIPVFSIDRNLMFGQQWLHQAVESQTSSNYTLNVNSFDKKSLEFEKSNFRISTEQGRHKFGQRPWANWSDFFLLFFGCRPCVGPIWVWQPCHWWKFPALEKSAYKIFHCWKFPALEKSAFRISTDGNFQRKNPPIKFPLIKTIKTIDLNSSIQKPWIKIHGFETNRI